MKESKSYNAFVKPLFISVDNHKFPNVVFVKNYTSMVKESRSDFESMVGVWNIKYKTN